MEVSVMAYKVKKGDTLSAIAKANNTTVAAIQKANPEITNVNLIRPGQVFDIPSKTVTPKEPVVDYSVQPLIPGTGLLDLTAPQNAASARLQAEANAYFAANPDIDPLTGKKKVVTPLVPDSNVGGGPTNIEQPVIPQTVSSTGNISTAKAATPTYTPPVLSAAEILAVQQAKAAEVSRVNAIDVLKQRFAQYGLESLATVIKDLAAEGASEATIGFALQNTPEYKERFKANELRLKKGLAVVSPAEYITLEDTYRQVLRSYGLRQFDNDLYVSQFIANDVSPTELTGRVQAATQRVLNAPPEVATTLRSYYNLGAEDLVAYALDPDSQLAEIQKKITAAEIGAAAFNQGLNVSRTTAEGFGVQGITQEQAQKGYSTIAEILPAAQKLSEIYGGLDSYGQSQAEKEVFGGMASEKRKREKLAQTEFGTFSGKSGISRGALGSQDKGAF
jgi:LysM repeat protein